MNVLLLIFLVLLIAALLGGGWGWSAYGPLALSPLGIVIAILLILFLIGSL